MQFLGESSKKYHFNQAREKGNGNFLFSSNFDQTGAMSLRRK